DRSSLRAVHRDTGAHNPARARRRKHHNRVRDFFGTAQAPGRHLMADEILLEGWILAKAPLPVAADREYRAGSDRVDADIFWRVLAREHLGERMQRRFRRVVGERPARLASVDRTDIDD